MIQSMLKCPNRQIPREVDYHCLEQRVSGEESSSKGCWEEFVQCGGNCVKSDRGDSHTTSECTKINRLNLN